jgi:hypothetical protein
MARYGKAASESVKNAVHREKRGELRSGKNGRGGVVKSREQAIAIGLSEARKRGAKVPRQKTSCDECHLLSIGWVQGCARYPG